MMVRMAATRAIDNSREAKHQLKRDVLCIKKRGFYKILGSKPW